MTTSAPLSPLEDIKLQPSERLKPGSARRHHKAFLANMYGAALTILDDQGRILFFPAAALRRREAPEHDVVLSMSVEQLFQGITGFNTSPRTSYQPEYEVIRIEGQDRHRDYPLVFREFPFISAYLGKEIPEAAAWGIMRFGPSAHKMFIGHKPNGTNSELFLDHESWKDSLEAGAVAGSGSNDLVARLHPRAIELASLIPSAWTLAVTSAYLFGGMSKIPVATPIKSSPLVTAMISHEAKARETKKAAMAAARIERMAADHEGRSMDVLRAAIDPAQLDVAAAGVTSEERVG
jgi:hypothetical protein